MPDKIKVLCILTLMLVLGMGSNVLGYTGKGTKNNPYVVSSETGLRGALTEHTDKKSWIYIAVDDAVAITDTIVVEGGKYRIYAIGGSQTIKRSSKLTAKVNDAADPKYCIKIMGDSQVVFGYKASTYNLVLNGNKDIFTNGRKCAGWLFVNTGTSAVIDEKCIFKDVINSESDSAPIRSRGNLTINGEISNCRGNNGGAIKSSGGIIVINSGANIHNCVSDTEGGAIHASAGGSLTMNGGQIINCSAAEEGGAIFLKWYIAANIYGGKIQYNIAGKSAGGIFAGYGAILTLGTSSGAGPEISYNSASGSGGGIRCNGGSGIIAGGTTYIYGGNIHHNTSGKYGGGIACGAAGEYSESKIIIKQITVSNNFSVSDGGGIWIPANAVGTNGNNITIEKSTINNNSSMGNGGGLMTHGPVIASGNNISGNNCRGRGGAVYINSAGSFTLSGGIISQNQCDEVGNGIYVNGKFKISSDACVDTNNVVYLALNTYIDIIGQLNKTSGYIAQIDSESKKNGTILIRAGYAKTTASKELYYSGGPDDECKGDTVSKKYLYYGLENNRCLRPSENVNGYDGIYIILSEKYYIDYSENTSDEVKNMPERQVKFWEENATISSNKIVREGCAIDEEHHWNDNSDGSGMCVTPGSVYTQNESITLYAQWVLWEIKSPNRYYVVGQDVVLDSGEIFKRVQVTDDENQDALYTFSVNRINKEDGEIIAEDTDIKTERYLNTSEPNRYILTFKIKSDKCNAAVVSTFKVYIIDTPITKGITRYISIDYSDTLEKDSRWNFSLKSELMESLEKKENQGMYVINLSHTRLKEIKKNVKNNNYIITHDMNEYIITHDMDEQLTESW